MSRVTHLHYNPQALYTFPIFSILWLVMRRYDCVKAEKKDLGKSGSPRKTHIPLPDINHVKK